jgi:hypothetical protein
LTRTAENIVKKLGVVLWIVLGAWFCVASFSVTAAAQEAKPAEGQSAADKDARGGHEYSGMYSFLKEGEFVQLTVEDDGRVTGFISRYGGDKGAFVDLFFKSGALERNKLSFTTRVVQGVSFDFKGTAERGAGKDPGDEAYYVLKGTLTENLTGADKKVTSSSREVELKGFPQEAGADVKK